MLGTVRILIKLISLYVAKFVGCLRRLQTRYSFLFFLYLANAVSFLIMLVRNRIGFKNFCYLMKKQIMVFYKQCILCDLQMHVHLSQPVISTLLSGTFISCCTPLLSSKFCVDQQTIVYHLLEKGGTCRNDWLDFLAGVTGMLSIMFSNFDQF